MKEERLQDLRVETPLGTIIVRPSCNSEHPGVWIDLCRTKADDDMPLALIEFSNDDSDLPEGQPNLITRVWGNGGDESYTDRIVHQGIEEYFRIEGGKYMGRCFMVIDSSYDVGLNVYAFWNREDAEKSVREDAQTVMADLEEQGYERIEVLEGMGSTTIYVPDTGISYEWEIRESEIR